MKPNLQQFIKNTKLTLVKHSPEILTGIGITGLITTTVLAVKATPKALRLIDKAKQESHKDELTALETVKATWKCYIPATAVGVTSVACLIGASSVSARRNAALATAYKLSETAFTEYKNKVVETIGEKKEKHVQDEIDKDHMKNNPVSKNSVIITEKGKSLCYDRLFNQYFYSDIDKIRKAVNELNRQMLAHDYVSLNDFYDELNIPHVEMGDQMGWRVDRGLIEIDFGSQLADDDTPCVVIRYDIPPEYGFSSYT